ncbi:hypothetical protein PMIN01_12719 [Paraphaeosphaeria minitans]|uniref:Uncharacterized protein n=1 Tax=Paraphaeosphaeria minitans TaxID=565426 RepID=A0A9P6G4Z1_9PLEO|nr:hypothetical protein PMIN01_12719 [Paraphaeosphaeria minitans]
MTGEATGVASSAGTGAAQAERRAIGLNVAEALAVVALLGLGGARVRASVGLVAGLLASRACATQEPCNGACCDKVATVSVEAAAPQEGQLTGIVAHVSALEARTTR